MLDLLAGATRAIVAAVAALLTAAVSTPVPRKLIATLLLASCATGCGYFVGGTWEDEPGNWVRAFRSEKPRGIVVERSRYSRFPRLSYEYEYYFHVAPNADLSRLIATATRLARLDLAGSRWSRPGSAPAWFAPGPSLDYETWGLPGEPENGFRVLVDRRTGDFFITDRRL